MNGSDFLASWVGVWVRN